MTSSTRPDAVAQLRDGRRWWLGLFGSVLLAFVFVAGLSLGGVWDDPGPSTEGLRNDRFTHLVQTGEAQEMVNRHQRMLEQMRVSLAPEMLQVMDADPMWKLMRNDEYTTMLERQQREIDRMLGRGAP